VGRLQAEERQPADHAEPFIPARLQARLDALELAAKTTPVDRAAINAAMRSLMRVVVFDYQAGTLVFNWQHDGDTDLMYGWSDEEDKPSAAPTRSLVLRSG